MQDPPEYFSGRYLAYKPDIPSELLRKATPPDREHPPQNMTHLAPQFDLVHHQYKQVRLSDRAEATCGLFTNRRSFLNRGVVAV